MKSTLETLQELLIHDHRLAAEQVTADAELAALGIDSLDLVELIFQVEDRYGIQIREDTPPDLRTIADVAQYIDRVRTSAPATPARAANPPTPPAP